MWESEFCGHPVVTFRSIQFFGNRKLVLTLCGSIINIYNTIIHQSCNSIENNFHRISYNSLLRVVICIFKIY